MLEQSFRGYIEKPRNPEQNIQEENEESGVWDKGDRDETIRPKVLNNGTGVLRRANGSGTMQVQRLSAARLKGYSEMAWQLNSLNDTNRVGKASELGKVNKEGR